MNSLVILEDGRTLHYDWLIVASGTKWEGPLAFPDDLEDAALWIQKWRMKIASSRDIILIGGGAVGVGT